MDIQGTELSGYCILWLLQGFYSLLCTLRSCLLETTRGITMSWDMDGEAQFSGTDSRILHLPWCSCWLLEGGNSCEPGT